MIPTIQWAQNNQYVLFKIMVENVTGLNIEFNNNKLVFTGYSNNIKYHIDLTFFKKIDIDLSNHSYKINEHFIDCKVKKLEESNWDYFVENQSFYKNHIKIDWLRWVDQEPDDADELDNNMNNLLENIYNNKKTSQPDLDDNTNSEGQLNLNGLEINDSILENNGVASGESTPCTSDEDELNI